MSETTTETTEQVTTTEQAGDPPELGDAGKKAIQAERRRATDAERRSATLQAEIDRLNAASMTELERAQKRATDAEAETTSARAETIRYRVAARHGISDADADLFLTGRDEDSITKQAERFIAVRGAAAVDPKTPPKPDPSQGASQKPAGGSPAEQFAALLGGGST